MAEVRAQAPLPPVELVRPGLWSIPVPIPDNPLRYVLVYLIEQSGGGFALVDAGWPGGAARRVLRDGIAQTGHDGENARAVLVTHAHLDHLGLAWRVREASGAWVG